MVGFFFAKYDIVRVMASINIVDNRVDQLYHVTYWKVMLIYYHVLTIIVHKL